jgi:hypothetical protein
MKRLLWVTLLAAGCSHAIKDMKDCNEVTSEKRLECNFCLAQNKADGWLGIFEYRPDAEAGNRCARVK